VVVSYFVPDSLFTDEAKATVRIMNAEGDTIRTLKTTPKAGLNKVTWGMNEKGVHFPSRDEPSEDNEPGGGPMVLPGAYKISISYEEKDGEVMAMVNADPRRAFKIENAKAQRLFIYDVNETIAQAEKAFSRVCEAKEMVEFVNKQITMTEDTLFNDLNAEGDSLMKSLTAFEDRYMLPKDFDGYDHVSKFLNNYLWRPRSYVGAPDAPLGQKCSFGEGEGRRRNRKMVKDVNDFFNGPWAEWQTKVESSKMRFFKEYEDL